MLDVTLGTSRRRRPSRKAEEEDSEEALPPRKPSPAKNEQASTGKEKKKAMKIVSGSTPSPGTEQVRHHLAGVARKVRDKPHACGNCVFVSSSITHHFHLNHSGRNICNRE